MAGSTIEAALRARLLQLPRSDYAPSFDRGPALALLEREGLPDWRSEPWRHTNIRRWYEAVAASHTASGNGVARETAFVTAPKGIHVERFSDASAAELVAEYGGLASVPRSAPLAAINAVLLGAGMVVRAVGEHFAEPVRIGTTPAEFQHLLVIVENGASLQLIEEAASFTHRIVEIVVGTGSRLTHWRRQAAAENRECSLVSVHIEADGDYRLAQSSRGADLRRNDVQVALAGKSAQATLHGAWRLDGSEHLDNQIAVVHGEREGLSRQIYRGVAAGHSRAILNGRIHIAPGADATDASLTSKNLLTSDSAQIFAKPELEIHASDVKCSHGATVGALDTMSVHYLRSRGIDEETVRALLTNGFLREAIADAEGAQQLSLLR